MSNIEMACIRLKQALQNKSAQERYTTMMSAKYTHPGWGRITKETYCQEDKKNGR